MKPIGALPKEVMDANSLEDMVGPWGLEPQTSTEAKTVWTQILTEHVAHDNRDLRCAIQRRPGR